MFENIQDWNEMTERIGYWVDLDDAYVTYDPGYVESCWWVMKELWDRGLLTEDYKVTWHSPSSNTTLASHEVSLGYREDVPDPSIYPAFAAVAADLAARGLPVDAGRRRRVPGVDHDALDARRQHGSGGPARRHVRAGARSGAQGPA